ncbi:hypothetical protein [Streptomyces sp900105755]|uniref:Uncharacterized protein n=1 Tax=Streptomyces sp. 900105755 TaxID=3154389 RepID=A0ABV1TVF1_9ACTN
MGALAATLVLDDNPGAEEGGQVGGVAGQHLGLTVDVALDDLRPFPGNARRGDPAVILHRTGQFRSLIVRDTGDGLVVLAGNHTLQALLAHGPGPCGMTTTQDGELPCALCAGQEWAARRPLRDRHLRRRHRHADQSRG